MKKLSVLLCGASDISIIQPSFKAVVNDFGAFSGNYLDSSHVYDNYKPWEINSLDSVKAADIIVYVIIGKYGSITWETEYLSAVIEGKCYILLCEQAIFDSFQKNANVATSQMPGEVQKLHQLLLDLQLQQRTIVKFVTDDFSEILRRELSNLFYDGIQIMNASRRGSSILAIVNSEDRELQSRYELKGREMDFLKGLLLSNEESSEQRARIVDFLAFHKPLTNEEIIEIMTNTPKVVHRRVIQRLFDLISAENDIEMIVDSLIAFSRRSTDVAVSNNAIPSILLGAGLRAPEFLLKFFPPKFVAVPNRILEKIDEHFDDISDIFLDVDAAKSCANLMELSFDYDRTSNKLIRHYESIQVKMSNLKNELGSEVPER